MFWHEGKDNDIKLTSYNKSNYLKLINQKKLLVSSLDSLKSYDDHILDLSENFKVDMIIPSDWGPGKVVSVNKNTKKVVLKIEGTEHTFDMLELRPYLQIYIHVFFKDKDLSDKRVILSTNVYLDETIGKIKKRIAGIFKSDENKVILYSKGVKFTNNNQKLSECGIFSQDTMLVVINGLCDY